MITFSFFLIFYWDLICVFQSLSVFCRLVLVVPCTLSVQSNGMLDSSMT